MRAARMLGPMGASVSVVLHLVVEALEEGRLAGEAEVVETGDRGLFASAEDLVDFTRHHRVQADLSRTDRPRTDLSRTDLSRTDRPRTDLP